MTEVVASAMPQRGGVITLCGSVTGELSGVLLFLDPDVSCWVARRIATRQFRV